MRTVKMRTAMSLICAGVALAVFASVASAGPHHDGPRHARAEGGWHWVAPAIAGGIVTYALIPPRVVYAHPPAYYPPPTVISPAPAQPSVYYYCDSSENYYPHVRACPEGWKLLPGSPSQ